MVTARRTTAVAAHPRRVNLAPRKRATRSARLATPSVTTATRRFRPSTVAKRVRRQYQAYGLRVALETALHRFAEAVEYLLPSSIPRGHPRTGVDRVYTVRAEQTSSH